MADVIELTGCQAAARANEARVEMIGAEHFTWCDFLIASFQQSAKL